MKIITTSLLFIIVIHFSSAQNVASLIAKGELANQMGKYDSALYYFKSATESNSSSVEEQYNALIKLGYAYLKKYEFEKASDVTRKIEQLSLTEKDQLVDWFILKGKIANKLDQEDGERWFDSAISLQPNIPSLVRLYLHKGLFQIFMYNQKEAQNCYDSAMQLAKSSEIDSLDLAGLQELSARIKWKRGDFLGALKDFKLSLATKRKLLGEFHPEVGFLTGNIGIMYKNLLQYDRALDYYILSLEFRRRYLGEGHIEVANMYNNIGYLYYLKDQFDEAERYHQKAYDIRIQKLPPNHVHVLQSIEHLGLCHGGKGEFDQAEEKFRRILQARIEKLGYDHHHVGYALYNLGAVAVEEKDFEKAANYFQEAILIGNKIYGAHNFDQADNYNRLAKCLLALNRFEEAAESFQLSIQYNTPGYKWSGKIFTAPDEMHYLSFREILRSYIGLAYAASELDQAALAKEYLNKAETIIYDYKLRFKNKKDLLRISASYKQLADCGIKVYKTSFEQDGDRHHLEQVFRYSELAKASTLLSELNEEKARRISGIPVAFLQRESDLRNEKDSLMNKILEFTREGIDDENLTGTKTAMFQVNRNYEDFLDSMESAYPQYVHKKFGRYTANIPDLQQQLRSYKKPAALLSYHLSDSNQLTTVLIKQDTFFITEQEADGLNELIGTFRSSLESQEELTFDSSSASLYALLIAPVQDLLGEVKRLVIIPDGVLGYIPFEILMTNDGNKYLMESHDISYELSSTLWRTRESRKSNMRPELLAYAPSFDQALLASNEDYRISEFRDESLGDLPGAKKEVVGIGQHFTATTLLGESATESHFKEEASKYDIIHFATHSVVNEKNTDYTRLYFQASSGENEEDGYLHAFELDNIELNARLVTLSACNTGFGKVEEGEGVMSLARSFTAAGVPGVVMSLWPASDKSTPILMESFYKYLSEGQSKDEALNNARKDYLSTATGKAKHPFYWGGFVLIGDTDPLSEETNSMWLLVLGLLVVLTAGVIIVKKNR